MPIPRIDDVENIARLARLNLAKDGFLAQTAFIWRGDKMTVIQGRPMSSKADKVGWAAIVRAACLQFEADTLLTVNEVWAAQFPGPLAPDDRMGDVKDKDGAYEAVMFHLESMDGTWSCIVRTVRSPGQPPSFPMPRFWVEGSVEGILANFIPDKKASAYKKEG